MPASAEVVYRFHAEPDALEQLTPPWENAEVIERTGGIEEIGSRVRLRLRLGPFSQVWVAEHVACEPGRMFRDVMLRGPFVKWEHTHEFHAESEESSWLEDRIQYELPFGWLGDLAGGAYVRKRLKRMFEWRHSRTRDILIERKQWRPERKSEDR